MLSEVEKISRMLGQKNFSAISRALSCAGEPIPRATESFNFIIRGPDALEQDHQSERERDIERLRQQLLSAEARSAQNPWTKAVHVVHTNPERGHEIVMANIDTQSPPNWVCVEIVQRLSMEDAVKPYEGPHFQGAGGEAIKTRGVVTLQWYDSQSAKSRWNEFLVTTNPAPVDLILGWQWIKEEGHTAFEEPVLAIRQMKLTPGNMTSPATRP